MTQPFSKFCTSFFPEVNLRRGVTVGCGKSLFYSLTFFQSLSVIGRRLLSRCPQVVWCHWGEIAPFLPCWLRRVWQSVISHEKFLLKNTLPRPMTQREQTGRYIQPPTELSWPAFLYFNPVTAAVVGKNWGLDRSLSGTSAAGPWPELFRSMRCLCANFGRFAYDSVVQLLICSSGHKIIKSFI